MSGEILILIFLQSVPLKIMGNIVNSQVQKIAQVSEKFAKLKLEVEDSGSLIRKQKDMILEKRNILSEQKKELEKEIEKDSQNLLQIKEALKQFDENKIDKENESHFRLECLVRYVKKFKIFTFHEKKFFLGSMRNYKI